MPADNDLSLTSNSGSSLLTSKSRQGTILRSSHQQFPPIPSTPEDFIQTGVNARPTFFGCDPQNQNTPEYPLVIYLPNAPPFNGDDPVTKSVGFLSFTYSTLELRNMLMLLSQYRDLPANIHTQAHSPHLRPDSQKHHLRLRTQR